MKYIFLSCLAIFGINSAFAGNFYYHPVHSNTITVVEQHIVSPVRVVRFREVKGLRFVEDSHGEQLILIGNKVLNTNKGVTESITEEIKGRTVTERIITRRDIYGNQTVTVEKEVSK